MTSTPFLVAVNFALLFGSLLIWLGFRLQKSLNETHALKKTVDQLVQVLAQSRDELHKISSAQIRASRKQAELQSENKSLSEQNGLIEDLTKRLENKIHSLKMNLNETQVDLGRSLQEAQTLRNQARDVTEKNTDYIQQINQLKFDYKALRYCSEKTDVVLDTEPLITGSTSNESCLPSLNSEFDNDLDPSPANKPFE